MTASCHRPRVTALACLLCLCHLFTFFGGGAAGVGGGVGEHAFGLRQVRNESHPRKCCGFVILRLPRPRPSDSRGLWPGRVTPRGTREHAAPPPAASKASGSRLQPLCAPTAGRVQQPPCGQREPLRAGVPRARRPHPHTPSPAHWSQSRGRPRGTEPPAARGPAGPGLSPCPVWTKQERAEARGCSRLPVR